MAAKPRVHEIASELGVDSKIALEKLKEMGEYVKGPSSSIEPPVARRLKAALEAAGTAANAAPAKAASAKAAAPATAVKPGPKPAPKPAPEAPEAPAEAQAAPVTEAPMTVAERQAQAEYQRVPLSPVVCSLVETPDALDEGAVAQLDSAGSRYRAGTLPAAVEVDSRQLHHLGTSSPTA